MKVFVLVVIVLFPFRMYAQHKAYNQKKTVCEFESLLNKKKDLKSAVRWPGYYSSRSGACTYYAYWQKKEVKDTLICNKSVFLFQNGLVALGFSGIFGMDQLVKIVTDSTNLKKYRSYFDWGTFDIAGDTINAIVFCNFCEADGWLFSCFSPVHYRGIIINQGASIAWQDMPPIPKSPWYTLSVKADTMSFTYLAEKQLIDSNKAWVNKYRK